MIEKQRLHAVGKTLPGEDKLVELFNHRHIDVIRLAIPAGVVIAGAKKIRVEHARHAVFTQQDERVGQRFEPGFNRGFQRLQGLGVVVGNQRHGMERIGFHQRTGENLAHIVVASLA